MKLIFSNSSQIDLGLYDIELVAIYKKIYKHLCHVKLEFRDWDNPYYTDRLTYEQLVDRLVQYAQKISVPIDKSRCLNRDQLYLNALHKIYETRGNFGAEWLDYHEHIHLCESFNERRKWLSIDYREKMGMLERPFNKTWLKDATLKPNAGDVVVSWAELGKMPYNYWRDNEPNDIQRMCELAKPWLILKPSFQIMLEEFNEERDFRFEEFKLWWKNYEAEWCQHWGLESWSLNDMWGKIVIGHLDNIEEVKSMLQKNINPIGVSM